MGTIQANNVQLNLKVGALKANLLRSTSQYNVTNTKLTKVSNDLEEITTKCDQLQIDVTQQQNLHKQKDAEIQRLTKEIVQWMKNHDVIQKRVQILESDKIKLANEVAKLRWVNVIYI